MTWKRYSYFCPQCKDRVDKVSNAYIVDEERPEAFCSEVCIVQFYSNQIDHFENQELKLRKSLGLEGEEIKVTDDQLGEYVERSLKLPKEIWVDRDELGNQFFYLINEIILNARKHYVILIAKYFGEKPSFIFHHIFTMSKEVLKYYQTGRPYRGKKEGSSGQRAEDLNDDELRKEELVLPKEVMDEMEQMRSEFVADMVSNRSDFDIDIEKFPLYENYIEMTLSDPDEVFEYKDKIGRDINVNIKAYSELKQTFFYFVICLKLDKKYSKGKSGDEVLIPIVSFPSIDKQIYELYQKGSCTTKKSLN